MSPQEKWVQLFTKVIGRQPTAQEFVKGKAADFDLKKIKEIALATASLAEEQGAPAAEQGPVQIDPISPVQPEITLPVGSPKKKGSLLPLIGLILAVVLVAGIGGYGYWQSRPQVTTELFAQAVADSDYQAVAKLLSTSEVSWKEKDVQALVNYLESQEITLTEVTQSLAEKGVYKDDKGNKILGLETQGKKWGVFPAYQLVLYSVELTITSDMENLTVDEEKVATGDKVFVKAIPFLPQEILVAGETALGSVETSLNVDLTQVRDNQLNISLALEETKLTVQLPIDGAEIEDIRLFVNEKEVATGLTASLQAFHQQTVTVKASFGFNGQTFETQSSKIQLLPEVNISLALSPEDKATIEQILAKKQEKRQSRALWNADKSAQLANFMVSWGDSMGQSGYKNLTATETGFVDKNAIRLNDVQDVTSEMSQDGTGNSDYQVVEIYRYVYPNTNKMHTYYFTIRADGVPIVLYSAQNQGGMPDDKFYMKETANEELKAGFAAIVNQ